MSQGSEQLPSLGTPIPNPPIPQRPVVAPALDIYETLEGLVLVADLPGVAPEGLEIRLQDNVLHMYGRVDWALPSDARLIHEEGPCVDFYRSFILSEETDPDKIQADFHEGVLKLLLPRIARSQPRKIEVRTGKP